jgi:hypothetical protein
MVTGFGMGKARTAKVDLIGTDPWPRRQLKIGADQESKSIELSPKYPARTSTEHPSEPLRRTRRDGLRRDEDDFRVCIE